MIDTPSQPAPKGERLAKVIARAGLCSRRDAEKWIADGRVSVDGTIVTSPATNVTEDHKVLVDGIQLAARHGTRLWLYHKPAGLVVTEKDPEGRETIFERLEAEGLPRVVTVGRLDINTEGLLLLTNDGGLKRVLELPATGWLRKYRVRAFGSIDQAKLDTLKSGMTVEGIKYGPIEATLERVQGGNVWLLVSLREGKNREVKNVLGALGLTVNRLIRVSYGPFQLGDLPIGAVSVVRARVLRDQLGEKLARQAGVDFDSDLPEEVVETPKKPSRNPRDPNARLGQRPARAAKSAPAPKPKTGEPRFARQRAEGKVPEPRNARQFEAPKPATRRVLFDDGRELVEEAPRQRRDPRSDDQGPGRSRSGPPGGRQGGFSDRSGGARDGGKPGGHAGRPGGARDGGKPGPRSGGKPGFGNKPGGRDGGRPASSGKSGPRGARPDARGPRKPAGPRGGRGPK